jgi:ATP-binding cassette, subfamily B (MDR/TAP), member 1
MTIVIGSLTQIFTDAARDGNSRDFQAAVAQRALYLVYIALSVAGASYVFTCCWIISGERISRRIRENFMRAVISQDMSFFDEVGTGEILTKLTSDINIIQDGLSEKIGLALSATSTFVTATIIALAIYWKLALIVLSALPAMLLSAGFISRLASRHADMAQAFNSISNNFANDVFSSPRVAQSLGNPQKLESFYKCGQLRSRKEGVKARFWSGIMLGAIFLVLYAAYALAFWQGSRSLSSGEVNTGNVVTILFAVIIGAFALSQVMRYLQVFVAATSAGREVFRIIDKVPLIDNFSKFGSQLNKVDGTITFQNVTFSYPARPDIVVLDDFSLNIPSKETTAIVGLSGSGKSTLVGLIERFYDPVAGQILLDGIPINKFNLASLRSHISLVLQEPHLFRTTVFDNVAYGLVGTSFQNIPMMQKYRLVVAACDIANITETIDALPQGFDSVIGKDGVILSGGQKQRVAIARAVVSNPEILILDEATAALDMKSEKAVQDALEKVARGRTTIIIAHRLSTIKNAHNIVVMEKGQLMEQGTHQQLLRKGKIYHALVQAQKICSTQRLVAENNNSPEQSFKINSRHFSTKKRPSRRLSYMNNSSSNFRYSGLWDPLDYGPLSDEGFLPDTLKIEPIPDLSAVEEKLEPQSSNKPPNFLHTVLQVGRFVRQESMLMASGLLASTVSGVAYSLQALVFAKLIVLFADPAKQSFSHEVGRYCNFFLLIGIITFFAHFVSTFLLGLCTEKMVERVRAAIFRSILKQEISWFEKDANSATRLLDLLSSQCGSLGGISGGAFGIHLAVAANLLTATILSIALSWRLGLIIIAGVPTLLGAGYLRWRLLGIFEEKMTSRAIQSAESASESITSMRTVLSLGGERAVLENYRVALLASSRNSYGSTFRSAFLFAFSQSLTYMVNAFSIWYGAFLIRNNNLTVYQFFVCFIAITFGAQDAGDSFNHAPNTPKARRAAASVLSTLKHQPSIDIWSHTGVSGGVKNGNIAFEKVSFAYPTRPGELVLSNISFTIQPGQFVALVGRSGCGKSSLISLIEQFYRPTSGRILVDGLSIQDYNLAEYRRSISLVSQEPTLYRGSIRFNILIGLERDASNDELELACKEANILTFIRSLPDGFETLCGTHGTAFSGGQKQRIAIARALIRKPRVLLLDEATSALDSESETAVQAALENAASARTTIAVAHRLSTIQRADIIYVIEHGRIMAQGTHHELLRQKGLYADLVAQEGTSQEKSTTTS